MPAPDLYCESHLPNRVALAQALAGLLQTKIVTDIDDRDDVVLAVTDARLELRSCGKNAPGPVFVDFVGGSLGFSRTVNRFGQMFKAVGFKFQLDRPTILDVTAGLCHDAFLLAYQGCKVTAVERSPVLFALIEDGLQRARVEDPALESMLRERLNVIHAEAIEVLSSISAADQPDVVYLDPMFPHRTKSALVKKEMRVLRSIVGDDDDAADLLSLARMVAKKRVVVKRMKHAPELAPDPMICFPGKTTRFDVYAPLPSES
ncbi:MAG: ribosomal RNA small subunit methyltransferase J [Phycisphaerae bacterium]|nr:MAG: ribosomal RNA small subunit methyltransferase J [Phycisphaerae bacterium]